MPLPDKGRVMPITPASLGIEMYQIFGDNGCAAVQTLRNEHILYDAASCRISDVWNVPANGFDPNKRIYGGAGDPNGPIYYLPYKDDRITSMRLPHNPPATMFLTANLSGCRFFVDTIQGSQDIMVFHANTHQYGAAPGAPANAQSGLASAVLLGQHSRAQADYRGKNPAVNLAEVAVMEKITYMLPGEVEVMRKRGHGRRNEDTVYSAAAGGLATVTIEPSFNGGTTIAGIYNGGWQFYYQTWGLVEYVRPRGAPQIAKQLVTFKWKSVHNARTKSHSVATGNTDQWVMDHQRFY